MCTGEGIAYDPRDEGSWDAGRGTRDAERRSTRCRVTFRAWPLPGFPVSTARAARHDPPCSGVPRQASRVPASSHLALASRDPYRYLLVIDVALSADSLTVRFRGIDALAARARRIHLTRKDVLGADVRPVSVLGRSVKGGIGGFKLGRLATIGHLGVRDRPDCRQVWAVFGSGEALVIETTLKRPQRIIFGHPEARSLARSINSRFLRGAVIPEE